MGAPAYPEHKVRKHITHARFNDIEKFVMEKSERIRGNVARAALIRNTYILDCIAHLESLGIDLDDMLSDLDISFDEFLESLGVDKSSNN